MKKFVAGANDAGQRLDKYLSKLLKNASMGMIYKWIRKKRVKINGKKQEISYQLQQGDVLELYINDEFFPESEKVPEYLESDVDLCVVYEDGNILVADKPSGMAAHGEKGCLLENIQGYLFKKGEYNPKNEQTFAPALCNRIDRNTSGLVIAAKNASALRTMNEKIRLREISKFYLLKIENHQNLPKSGKIAGYTLKNEGERKIYFFETEKSGSKYSETLFRKLDDWGNVEAQLITGRTHQIRAGFAHMGCPLVGDVKYGATKNGKRDFQQLRAYKIVFDFESDAGELGYLKGKIIEKR
ncbi:MAG: RluA family pseudouridine synthase [Clostridia bacterium]|nr:RluA family pseudouridine synthase [Clostridia bacterium]